MKIDWITILAMALMTSSAIAAVAIYYNEEHRECISNPLVYAAQSYEEKYGYEFVGSGSFNIEGGQSPIIFFDSFGVTVNSRPSSSIFIDDILINITANYTS